MAQRHDVQFPSGDAECAAWLYLPDRPEDDRPAPVVVMAHGLGGTREMRLDAFAERFAAAGFACLVFDYRHFGASGGEPRQLLSVRRQLQDWDAALRWVRGRADLDASRIALWGTSFGGGHVLAVAARDHDVAAVIAQCPFTDGLASGLAMSPASTVKVGLRAIPDAAVSLFRGRPITVPLAGPPRTGALMTAPDALPGCQSLQPDPTVPVHRVAARIGLEILTYRPGRRARTITCPTLAVICEHDSVAPPGPARRQVRRAPRATVIDLPYGHFDIYLGDPFEESVTLQVAFLREHLSSRAGAGSSGTPTGTAGAA